MITNEQIAKAFDNYASLLEFLDRGDPADPFRVRTYRKIANIVRNYDKNIYELWKEGKLEKIPGFGKETWAKLLEFLET
jgi:DNA polymerase (family 10)